MTDFLSRLAGRTAGTLPTVQPALIPIYAPASAPAFGDDLPSNTMPSAEESSAFSERHLPVRNRSSLPLPAPQLSLSGEVAEAQSASLTLPISPSVLLQMPHTRPSPLTPELPATLLEEPGEASEKNAAMLSTDEAREVVQDTHIAPHRHEPSNIDAEADTLEMPLVVSSAREARASLQQDAPRFPHTTPSDKERVQLMPDPLEGVQQASDAIVPALHARVALQAGGFQRRDNAIHGTAQDREAQPAPQETPTIHVTIGRIEVRATPPESHPQPHRPEPRVTGLDEYLKQRAGGGR